MNTSSTGRKPVKYNSVWSYALPGVRQLSWFVIGFAVELLNFFAKVCAVITVRVRKLPCLTLVIPIIGIQSLRFFEVRNCVDAFALFVEILSQRKLRISANAVAALRFQSRS